MTRAVEFSLEPSVALQGRREWLARAVTICADHAFPLQNKPVLTQRLLIRQTLVILMVEAYRWFSIYLCMTLCSLCCN